MIPHRNFLSKCRGRHLRLLFVIVCTFCLGAAVVMGEAAAASGPPTTAAQKLPASGRIVIGGDAESPPFAYLDENGRPAGFNVDLTRAIARETGLDIEIRLGPWNDIRKALTDGDIDALQGMFHSLRRDSTLDFTVPYTANHYVGVVRKGTGRPPASLADLAGKRIVVEAGDFMYDFALENGLSDRVSAVASQEDAIGEVSRDKYDCALVSRLTALYWINKNSWHNLRVSQNPLFSPEFCYAVPNDHKALHATLEEGLKILEKTGEYRKIYEKWMGGYGKASSSLTGVLLLRYGLMTAIPLLVVLSVVLLWLWILRRQMALKTKALRQSNEFQRAMIACSSVAIYSLDMEERVLTWNESAERIFGWTAGEIIGRPLPIAPEDQQKVVTDLQKRIKAMEGVSGMEVVCLRKDGSRFHGKLSVDPMRDSDGRLMGTVATLEDITERRRVEDVQRYQDELLRDMGRHAKIGGWEFDVATGRGTWTEEVARIHDLDPADETGVALGMSFYQGESLAKIETAVKNAIEQGEPYDLELEMVTARGTHNWVRTIGRPKMENGKVVNVRGSFQDVTDLVKAREALRLSEERFRTLVDAAPEGVFVQGDGRFLFLNPAMVGLLGASSADELLGKEVFDRIAPEYHNPIRDRFRTEKEKERPLPPMELEHLRMDGSRVFVESAGVPFRFQGQDARVVFVRDCTARRKAEKEQEALRAQLQQAQKMESVGRLAGGVAHDYNNMLSVIMGFAEMALEKVGPEETLHGDLMEILKAAERSMNITRQLLAFARRQPIAPRALDLNETVEGMLNMLRRLIGEDIDLVWHPRAGVWPVKMDPSQIDQILANLAINARDAIEGVGKITIETDTAAFDAAYCRDHAGFIPGEFVMLAVSDDGCGMAKETVAKLFEPFFTTKGVGKGTGLGMATVYGILKQNDGFVNVYSEPGRGTTIKIYLPRHGGPAIGDHPSKVKEVPESRGETVMVVEDEPATLKMIELMLTSLGYKALMAGSPSEAVRLAEAHAGPIALLITDVVMPEMNGQQLARQLRALLPEMKILFMSGYTADVIAHRGVLDEGVNFIQKPFSKKDLAAKIRAAI